MSGKGGINIGSKGLRYANVTTETLERLSQFSEVLVNSIRRDQARMQSQGSLWGENVGEHEERAVAGMRNTEKTII